MKRYPPVVPVFGWVLVIQCWQQSGPSWQCMLAGKNSQMPKPTTILNWTKQIWTDKTEKRKSFRTRLGLIKHIVRVNIDSSLVRLAENCRSNVSASSDNCCLLGGWMAVLLGGAVRGRSITIMPCVSLRNLCIELTISHQQLQTDPSSDTQKLNASFAVTVAEYSLVLYQNIDFHCFHIHVQTDQQIG